MFGVNNNVCVIILSFICVLSSKSCHIMIKSNMILKTNSISDLKYEGQKWF